MLYTDGSKIEADANRYALVRGKAIRTNRRLLAIAHNLRKKSCQKKGKTSFKNIYFLLSGVMKKDNQFFSEK
jgi:hypothetical protein